MLTDEASIQPGLYGIPNTDIASNVLIPGFRAAQSVRGAFGWFSAGWIKGLAPGLVEYLNRDAAAPIDFTVAPALYPAEKAAVERAIGMTPDIAAQLTVDVFVNGRLEATALEQHALDCLAWMIATNRLRLRIAVPVPESHYHPKIWLFEDGSHHVLVRGSGNATYRGIAGGVEHFDVDVSWLPESRSRVTQGVTMLEEWAEGKSPGISEVVDLPEALARKIISMAPSSPPQQSDYEGAVKQDRSQMIAFGSVAIQRNRQLRIPDGIEWESGPYAHQGEAVAAWEGGEQPERGVVAMVTAGGKTIAALICATRAQNRMGARPFLVVISAPSIPLIMQWSDEVRKFGVTPITPSLGRNSELELTRLFRGLRGGRTHVVIVTNNMLCSRSFQKTVADKIGSKDSVETMLIADEAHTLGADTFIANKPDFFERRLALSATPERQYDPDGTEEIFAFFGPTVHEFGMGPAIGFCLVPYNYYVHACTLDGDELDRFVELSRRIGAKIGTGVESDDQDLRKLLIARRRIIETASSKIALLRSVLEQRGVRSLEHALIYASAKNPSQFDNIAKLLTELGIKWAPVTQETTKSPHRLESTLEAFKSGACQVVLAKKVLDEGINIPSIREAFIVASSTIEREWVQRRGRVLRKHPGKPWAIVHDILALPPTEVIRKEEKTTLTKIVRNELGRAYTFGAHARNVTGVNGVQAGLERIRDSFWPLGDNRTSILERGGAQVIAAGTPRGKPW